ncbi:hypothetical protein GSI_00411 [Ganoderma sinense ZZ0214-1]|uniref:Uncharacterized protein n=1 Tax=Ganoderma sinense ZZ0214-1 TaxID=1077348 RepID=A0A2G8SSL5_9APHY|nr:hypothetical protein GSI_00411 [Ganoderma sinense ZZ0214-1]
MSKRKPARITRRGSTFSSNSDYSSQYSESGSDSHSTQAIPHAAASLSSQEYMSRTSAGSDMQSAGGTARHSRRTSTPSEGGADRRRLAIVEMDPNSSVAPLSIGRKRSKGVEGEGKSVISSSMPGGRSGSDGMGSSPGTGTLFSRRGLHIGGLALVAPPDASPKTYTDLTPPSTAPVSTAGTGPPPHVFVPTHTRSASEAAPAASPRSRLHHKSSRDVGIVGSLTSASTASESLSPASPAFSDDYHIYAQNEGLGIPLFQTPAKSRPSSPGGTTPELSDASTGSTAFQSPHQRLLSTPIFGMEDGIVTPAIGEGKDISQPVVGPVIVGLSPTMLQSHSARRMATNVSAATRGSPSVQTKAPARPSPSSHASSSSTSPYLLYQPGVHATAGPLPPPPRSIFDRDSTTTSAPPRPPRFHTPLPNNARRDIDAIKEALQLPQSVSAKLAARTPPEADKRLSGESPPCHPDTTQDTRCSEESAYTEESDPSVKLVASKPVHIREGAFPPSKIMAIPPGKPFARTSPSPIPEESHRPGSPRPDTRPAVVVEQEEPEQERESGTRRPAMELRRESSWVSLSQELALCNSSSNGKASKLPAIPVSRSPSSISAASTSSSVSHLPSLPPKSIRGGSDDEKPSSSLAPSAFKVITNLKRFSSLPRTPSRSSRSSKCSTSPSPDPRRSLSPPRPPSHDDQHPPVHVESPPRLRMVPKVKYSHAWPPAMSAADIVILRSPRERAKGYAMKINELSTYDCGLREWLASQGRNPVSHLRTQSQRSATQQAMHPLPVEFGGMPPGMRHGAQGSLASDMTFPIRSDAYTATDLSTRPTDTLPSSPPAILPYPSLAQVQLQRAPARSSTLILSPTKTLQIPLPGTKGSGTGFFASLGRKTSIRKEKGSLLSGPQSPTKVLSKHRPQAIASSFSQPTPARPPVQLAPPSIPGGPRAAPGYIKRAKTYSVGPGVPSVSPTPSPPRVTPSPPQTAIPQLSVPTSNNNGSKRQSIVMARRPSIFGRSRQGHTSVTPANTNHVHSAHPGVTHADPNFERQVNKLADLLPNADRSVLAGYLRRAGEDILAIGQYLEDEKSGTLRRD